MWAIFSCVAELPQIIRRSHENIIFHSLWSGPNLDFNMFLKEYNSQKDDIVKNGLFVNGIKIIVDIHGFIADSPARSKALNCKQFNGKYGCIMCLHPTTRNSTKIYPLLPNIRLRKESTYLKHLKQCLEQDRPVKGIKRETYLNKWLNIPTSILIDYMHLCLIGTFKGMINNLFNTKNRNEPFYLGKLSLINLKFCN